MGVTASADTRPLPAGAAQDAVLKTVTDALTDKGFVVAQVDKLVNWARTGSLWPMISMTFNSTSCFTLWNSVHTVVRVKQ